nr:hypothetical protein [Tanacetum cinerariifolium]
MARNSSCTVLQCHNLNVKGRPLWLLYNFGPCGYVRTDIATTKVKHVNEEAQLHAKVDGKKVIISEASIRRDLRFGDEEAQQEVDEGTEIPIDTQPHRKQKTRKPKRKDIELPHTSVPTEVVADKAVYEEMYDSVERGATTATSLDAEQDRGSGPRRQETMGDVAAQTRSKRVSKLSNDPPLLKVITLRSEEDRLQLKELIDLCTKLSDRVLDLETTKTTQEKEIANLRKRVKRLERKKRSRTYRVKRLYKIGLSARVELSTEEDSLDQDIFSVDDQDDTSMLDADKGLQEIKKSKPKGDKGATTTITAVTIPTLDNTRPKERGVVMQEPSDTTTTITIPIPSKVQDKGKDIQAKVEADYDVSQRLQAKKQENLTDAKKERLFMQFFDKRRKFFAAKRAEEKRNRPPIKAQQRKLKRCLEIIHDDGDDVTIEATPLSLKSPTIVDYKIYKEGRKSNFQIIRADDNSQMYLTFSKMLKNFNKEDLE